MEGVTIRHRLDFLLKMIDTTNGQPADIKLHELLFDGKPVSGDRCLLKGHGICCFINTGCESGELTVLAAGYEEQRITLTVGNGKASEELRTVPLIPRENPLGRSLFYTLKGEKEGIEWIQGIQCRDGPLHISGYDREKHVMTLVNTGKVPISRDIYGVFHQESETYETLRIIRHLTDTAVEISTVSTEPFSVHQPLVPVISGQVSDGGKYLFRVRADGWNGSCLIRYGFLGKSCFRRIELSKLETTSL